MRGRVEIDCRQQRARLWIIKILQDHLVFELAGIPAIYQRAQRGWAAIPARDAECGMKSSIGEQNMVSYNEYTLLQRRNRAARTSEKTINQRVRILGDEIRSRPLISCIILCLLLLGSALSVEAATVIKEKIIFLKEDGQHYLGYETIRTNYSSYDLNYLKVAGGKPEDNLKGFFYINPNEYTWDATSNPQYDLLKFAQGSWATLGEDSLGENLTLNEKGTYIFGNWNGKTKTSEGHYGEWNSPDNFSQFVYVWVFPQNFDIVKYECNRGGDWVKRHNTITYYGKNVNDLVFSITYRLKSQQTFEALTNKFAGNENVQLKQQEKGVKVTVGATVLFPSGKSELTKEGKILLTKVIEALKERGEVSIIVEGHTNNVPITGALAKVYPTNWELSAARSLTVLHYLAEKGISESRLEARAYGSQRPIASNQTEQGKARNRRIELMIAEPEVEKQGVIKSPFDFFFSK
jgi:flagellar motor protein MotB